MDAQALQALCQWESQRSGYFREILDLTGQMAAALGRRDPVTFQLMLHMRQEPVLNAETLMETVRQYLCTLPEEDAIRGSELLNGAQAGAEPGEARLALLVGRNRETLARILEQDKSLSTRVGGRMSFYRLLED